MITFNVADLTKMNVALKDFLNFLEEENVSDDDVFYSRLVSCELITNVIRHFGETAYFVGRIKDDTIEIYVYSKSSGGELKSPTLPDVFAESGRGLYIINAICNGDIRVVGNCIEVRLKYEPKN
jgi:anti-sigma regulatory factor (Ser/Thr protein kinase)